MTELTLRALREDELPAAATLLAYAFLTDDFVNTGKREALVVEPGRGHGVYDGDELIGVAQVLTRRMVFPGAGLQPVAAVTSVGVAASHRRRGALTMLMRAQLTGLHESGGEAVAALWASETAIYGRFGYGLATEFCSMSVPARAAFRPGVDLGADRVLEMPREKAFPLVRKLYEQIVVDRVGALERDDRHWDYFLYDAERERRGATAYRFAVHPEGYAVFRTRTDWGPDGPRGQLTVAEAMAATPQAYAALHRYLLDMDLVATMGFRGSTQEPLTHLLLDSRALRRNVSDALWVRLVDVDRALPQRRYAAPADLVLDVDDPVCPWNEGRWRLRVAADGTAEVSTTDAAADVALGVDDLGALFLGGTRPSTLAAAGRVRERTPGALVTLSRAFQADTVPVNYEVF